MTPGPGGLGATAPCWGGVAPRFHRQDTSSRFDVETGYQSSRSRRDCCCKHPIMTPRREDAGVLHRLVLSVLSWSLEDRLNFTDQSESRGLCEPRSRVQNQRPKQASFLRPAWVFSSRLVGEQLPDGSGGRTSGVGPPEPAHLSAAPNRWIPDFRLHPPREQEAGSQPFPPRPEPLTGPRTEPGPAVPPL